MSDRSLGCILQYAGHVMALHDRGTMMQVSNPLEDSRPSSSWHLRSQLIVQPHLGYPEQEPWCFAASGSAARDAGPIDDGFALLCDSC